MPKSISIIIPAYNEEKNIPVIIRKINKILKNLHYLHEIIVINDGSRDNSAKVVQELSMYNKNIKLINLSRNFGKESAISAGLNFCYADAAIIIDADLQHPPSLIPELVKKWEEGYMVVEARRKASKNEPFLRKVFSKLFYFIFNIISEVKMQRGSTDFRLLDKNVITIINKMTERNRMFRGLIDWTGYKSTFIEFIPNKRLYGKANYNFKQLLKLALNSFTSFSLWPLKALFFVGLIVTFCSLFVLILMPILQFIILKEPELFRTIAYVVIFQTFLSGTILTALGLIAIYIGNIHYEILGRPMFIVKSKINIDDKYS